MADTCHYTFVKPIECTTPKMNPHINYGLWMIMLYQCRFIDCNKCTTLGVAGLEGQGDIWELSVLSAQFCCEPKTALKNKVNLNFFFIVKVMRKWKLGKIFRAPCHSHSKNF